MDEHEAPSIAVTGRAEKIWTVALLAGLLLVALLTFRDYGITWDESVQARYGELVVDYFASGLQDRGYQDYLNLHYYGASFEALAAGVYRLAGTAPYETRHLITALAAILAVLAVTRYGANWRSPWVVVCAGLALVLMPRFYGHAFNNSKDIPFACAFAWAMVAITRMITRETIRKRDLAWTGLAVGLAASIRVGGLILLAYAAAGFIARVLIATGPGPRDPGRRIKRSLPRWALGALLVVAIAWSVMVVGWPWAHENPLSNPIRAGVLMSDFEATKEVLYRGETFHSQEAPRSYLFWYLLITIPLPLALLAIVGSIAVAREPWQRRDRARPVADVREPLQPSDRARSLASVMLMLWIVAPMLFFVVMRPTAYDGIRHYLFVLPAIAVLVGIGVDRARHWSAAAKLKTAWTALALLLLLLPLRDLIVLHPYQSSYFNGLVGGIERARANYEVDYWASSYKEVGEWIRDHAPPRRDGLPLRVLIAGNARCKICVEHYLQGNFQTAVLNRPGFPGELPPAVDYFVAINRRRLDANFPEAPVVHEIRRDGAVIAVIKGRR